jgi:hypothetical protein
MFGFWNMKKWALYLYSGSFLFNQILLNSILKMNYEFLGMWGLLSVLIPLIPISVAVYHYNKMD